MANPYRGYPYSTWRGMVMRCHDESDKDYQYYGARGVTVHHPWRHSLARFVDDVFGEIGERPDGMQIDRTDNLRGYEPGNVRWVTPKTNNNNRRSNKLLSYKGETLTAAQWADRAGLPRQQVANRINRGWSIEKALTAPLEQRATSLTIDGVSRTVTEWSKAAGTPRTTINNRLRRGVSPRAAVYGSVPTEKNLSRPGTQDGKTTEGEAASPES